MPVPQITALPDPPSRQDPTNFAVKGDAFLGALPDFVTGANALATQVNERVDAAFAAGLESAATNAATTVTKAAEARASELAAAGYANQAAQMTTAFDTLRPRIRAALNLDFVNQEVVDRRVVVSRSGPKSYFGKRKVLGDENLVRFSEQFDNGAWTKATMTITANAAIAPDGQTTADQARHSSAAGQTAQAITGTANAPYVFSMFVKESVAGFVRVTVGNLGGAYFGGWFNTTTGAWATTDAGAGGTFTSAAVVAYPNGWYRISIIGSNNATNYNTSFYLTAADNTSVRSTTPVIFTWGAQLEQRSTLTAYTRTTDYPVRTFFNALETAAANVMPIEYDPVSQQCLGIKPESAATNLLLRSEESDNASWAKTLSSVVANTVVAPNGTLSGELIVPNAGATLTNAGSANGSVRQTATVVSGTTYVFSIYAKAEKFSTLRIRHAQANLQVGFNLLAGTVSEPGNASWAGSIQSVGGGWYRCVAIGAAVSTSMDIGLKAGDTGDGVSGVFVWGAQLEASTLGVPSSYIPTTTAQVTRLADNLTVPVTEFDYNQNEGTLYAEVNTPVAVDSGLAEVIAAITDGTTSNRILLYRDSEVAANQTVRAFISFNGVTQINVLGAANAIAANTLTRIVFTFSRTTANLYANGVLIGTAAITALPNLLTSLAVGGNQIGTQQFNGGERCLRYYNVALSAAEAQALSKV